MTLGDIPPMPYSLPTGEATPIPFTLYLLAARLAHADEVAKARAFAPTVPANLENTDAQP